LPFKILAQSGSISKLAQVDLKVFVAEDLVPPFTPSSKLSLPNNDLETELPEA
jgi:hypothetical protein